MLMKVNNDNIKSRHIINSDDSTIGRITVIFPTEINDNRLKDHTYKSKYYDSNYDNNNWA